METPTKVYDVGIIGAGAAGLTASIYASRYQLSNIVFGTLYGGEIANASVIENYPGFVTITGSELTDKMVAHVKHFGAEVKPDKVLKINPTKSGFELITESGESYRAKTVIITTGTKRRRLNVPGEEKLAGRGVSYCVTCDAAFFKEKVTAVVGGGDAAMTGALHAAMFSPKVYLIVRGDKLSGEPIWQERVKSNPRVTVIYQTEVTEIIGEKVISAVKLSRPYEGKDELAVEGVFVEIGAVPEVELAKSVGVELDENGFIKVSENMATNVHGVFAAGDSTTGNAHLDQIISAAAEGGLAARAAFWHLGEKENKPSFFDRILNFKI